MSLPVLLRPEAFCDLVDTFEWYGRQKVGLGDDFLAQVSVGFARISDFPEMYGTIWEDVRAFRLRRFPYVVYFRTLSDRIEVFAVLHGSRDPGVWKSRAGEN